MRMRLSGGHKKFPFLINGRRYATGYDALFYVPARSFPLKYNIVFKYIYYNNIVIFWVVCFMSALH
jgi:hypothetical protein